jgi:hypothetical protein
MNIFTEILKNLPREKFDIIPDNPKDKKCAEQMRSILNEIEFYHFGLLPQVCIHSLDKDEYSKSYIAQEICDCGCKEWIESTIKMFEDYMEYDFPLKRVHRCQQCNTVRIAHHIGVKDGMD